MIGVLPVSDYRGSAPAFNGNKDVVQLVPVVPANGKIKPQPVIDIVVQCQSHVLCHRQLCIGIGLYTVTKIAIDFELAIKLNIKTTLPAYANSRAGIKIIDSTDPTPKTGIVSIHFGPDILSARNR